MSSEPIEDSDLADADEACSASQELALPVVVLGSLNMDLVLTVDQIPRPGETVLASSASRTAGGKGANQAVAAAQLGGQITLIGRLGADTVGREIRANLMRTGMNLEHVRELSGSSSGLATVTVDSHGENAIVVSPGANHQLTPSELAREGSAVVGAGIAVAQLETPLDTVASFAELCDSYGVPLILNAAPSHDLSDELLARCEYLIVNRDEASSLTGIEVDDRVQAVKALQQLLDRGVCNAIVTLGAHGCLALSGAECFELGAYKVSVLDTTGAGDAFVGAFAAALASRTPMDEALRFAAAAGAITCEVAGARQEGLTADRVQALMDEQPDITVHKSALGQ